MNSTAADLGQWAHDLVPSSDDLALARPVTG